MENISATSSKSISQIEQQIDADETLSQNVDDPPTKFTDLPQYCVEKILSFLELDELNAVASTTDHLKAISIRVFDMKFKNELIEHYPNKFEEYFALSHKYDKYSTENKYGIGRMWCNFPLLVEHFGSMIRKLSMSIPNQRTLNNLTKKFSSNLVELNVFMTRRNIRLTQPFNNLTKLTDSWLNVNQYFPELRCLVIRSTSSSHYESVYETVFINHNIPNLREFAYIDISLSGHQSAGFIQFLNMNPQLEILRLAGCLNELNNIQKNIKWDSFQIQHLNISTNGRLDVGAFAKLKHLQSLKIAARQYFELEILRFNQLKSASICFRNIPKPNDFRALVNLCPVLNDIEISLNEKLKENVLKFIMIQINKFLIEMKQLKEIKIQIHKGQSFESLQRFESIAGKRIVALAEQYPNRSMTIWFGRKQIPDLDIGVDFEGRFRTLYSKYKQEHESESDFYSDDRSSVETITDDESENDTDSDDFNFDGSNYDDDSDDSFENDSDGYSIDSYYGEYGMKKPRFDY